MEYKLCLNERIEEKRNESLKELLAEYQYKLLLLKDEIICVVKLYSKLLSFLQLRPRPHYTGDI